MAHDWQEWEKASIERLGRGMRAARQLRGISQSAVAEGAGITRGQVANLETSGRVQQLPSIGTLMRIAAALEVPPLQLLYPDLPDGEVEYLPGHTMMSIDALQTFAGERSLSDLTRRDTLVLRLARQWRATLAEITALEQAQAMDPLGDEDMERLISGRSYGKRLAEAQAALKQVADTLKRELGSDG